MQILLSLAMLMEVNMHRQGKEDQSCLKEADTTVSNVPAAAGLETMILSPKDLRIQHNQWKQN